MTKLKMMQSKAILIIAFSMAAYEREEALLANTKVRPVAKKVMSKQANGIKTVQKALMGCISSIVVHASY